MSQQDQLVITRLWQARRYDDWSSGEGLGGRRALDVFNVLEVYRGEKKRSDDADEGVTDLTEEA
jgi:hypothetical protein